MNALSENDRIDVIRRYFAEKGPVFHQFESWEYMMNTVFQKIIDESPSIYVETPTLRYKASFGQVYVEKASFIDDANVIHHILPNEARLRDLTYESPVFVDLCEQFWELGSDGFIPTQTLHHKKALLMKIPMMVRSSRCNLYGMSMDECIVSGECMNDPGGYFIINGKERALICQERLNYNQIYVFETNDEKSPFSADIRSMSEETGHSALIQARMSQDHKTIVFSLPYMAKDVAAGAVFKALGMTSDEIRQYISPLTREESVITERLIRESIAFTNKLKAISYLSKSSIHKVDDDEERRAIYTEQVIENELFPHMGISTPHEKCILLGDMLNKLFRVALKTRQPDDRDNVSLKRIEGPGILVADLFRMSLKRYCDSLKKYLEKRQDVLTAMNRTNSITTVFKHTFSTGNWAAQKNTYVRTGVSQIMSRLTYPATISHLRRVVIPVGKEGKNVKIRQIHPTQTFFIDIIESPEGKSIGIVKNLSLLANISTGCNSVLIRHLVTRCDGILPLSRYLELQRASPDTLTRIYVNGTLLGLTQSPDGMSEQLFFLRDRGLFSNQVSFFHDPDDREIRVFCDHGRYVRPVLNVNDDNRLVLTKEMLRTTHSWSDLVDADAIRYIDSNEVESSLVAMIPEDITTYATHHYDYCEIHPSAMLGVCSAVIPYPEHNQSPRLVYQSSMVKQALGIYALSFQNRFDTVTHVMHYPQKPMASTQFDEMLHYDEMLSGCNPIVAIATYGGWNQEDSVMLNRSAVDRGMFVHTCYKTMVYRENKKNNCSFERIEKPPAKAQNKAFNYSKLGENGIAMKGVPLQKGDVVIGKTLTKIQKEEEEKIDCSLIIGNGEDGIVDGIWDGFGEDGTRLVKVRIRQLRIPEVGDKFASRSSQKGVCGLLLPQEDMPFSLSGITPDIIINPHCAPSRMTLSQLTEMLLGKTAALDGTTRDSTAFTASSINPVEAIAAELQRFGFERYGNERLCSGYTGEMMDAEIFIGVAYYQRLKHLVKDKMHCLTPDHDVLTNKGWKPIASISIADKVATLDAVTNEIVYQAPTQIWSYPGMSKWMVHVKSAEVDLSVTAHHRMWVAKPGEEFEFQNAHETVTEAFHYQSTAMWTGGETVLDARILSMKALAETDEWVRSLSREQSRDLIDHLIGTEGVYMGTQIDLLQHVCFHAGWRSQIEGKMALRVYKDEACPMVQPGETVLRKDRVPVICLTVPNEIFFVRRNGKAVWTGNSRARGNVTMMHNQPSEGRSKDGGLRTGEMERDALIAHGGSAFIQETFFDMSDVYQVNLCESCGSILSAARECRVCKRGDVVKTNIPYCAKLLLQELQALGISIRIGTI